MDIVNSLREAYNLGAFSFKQIDNFLYTEGQKLIAEKERLRAARKDIAALTEL